MGLTLEGSTVLVTGGAGLIGSAIVEELVRERVARVLVLDNFVRGRMENLAAARESGPVEVVEGDVRDAALVRELTEECDYVFHQAAIRITLCAQQPRECVDVLVGGTLNVFEAAVASGVLKVVYASSASVYGAADQFPTSEQHPPYNNRTIYGAAKLMNEGIARSFHAMYGLPSVGLRYFNVYGPRMDMTGAYTEVMIRWLDCIDENRPAEIHGDPSVSMDLVYVDDVARANILALKADAGDRVYNVGSGVETNLGQLWTLLQQVSGAPYRDATLKPASRANPVPRRLSDIRLACNELGYEPRVSLEEGLRRLVEWRREQQTKLQTQEGELVR